MASGSSSGKEMRVVFPAAVFSRIEEPSLYRLENMAENTGEARERTFEDTSSS
jgi:hypothetical protein